MSDDLVEKLRDRKVCSIAHNSCRNDYVCEDAAARIEAQAARIAELEAALANARRDGMEEMAQIAADYEAVAYQHGNLPISDPNECAAQAAREIAASIRAALEGGKKDE